MHETHADLERLQRLLDASYRVAGSHLLSIHTPDRRLDAAALAGRLTGVRVMALATTTSDGRPLTGPVDGLFYRGEFWFGSGARSLRFAHIRARTQVSATHTDGESLGVTVHGRAVISDLGDPANRGFRDYCAEVYPDWGDWALDAVYARIEADRMFTFAIGD